MGRELSFGLGRVLERIGLTSVAARHRTLQSETQDDSTDQTLPIGQRRILEHVAATSVQKRLEMPQ